MILKKGIHDPLVKQLKVLLNVHGSNLDPTNLNFGDLTDISVRNFQGLNGLTVDGEVDTEAKDFTWDKLHDPAAPVQNLNPLRKIAEVAERFLGVREVTANRSPEIAKMWELTNYREGMSNREPWCCAFTVFCIQTADKETEEFNLAVPPQMAACSLFMEWARNPENKCTTFGPDSTKFKPQRGDIVCYLPHLSHIGIVAQDYKGDGFIRTVEGNTNGDGSREGDGVYAKQRRLSFAGSFIRLPAAVQTA